jgi:hypothetical protein
VALFSFLYFLENRYVDSDIVMRVFSVPIAMYNRDLGLAVIILEIAVNQQ